MLRGEPKSLGAVLGQDQVESAQHLAGLGDGLIGDRVPAVSYVAVAARCSGDAVK